MKEPNTEQEVSQKARTETEVKRPRRRFTAAYKLKILEAAERCGPGELGALLRREGLYSSSLTKWRREKLQGVLDGLKPKRRGSKSKKSPEARRIEQLEREKLELEKRLSQAETILDFQKKACEIFGVMPHPSMKDERHK